MPNLENVLGNSCGRPHDFFKQVIDPHISQGRGASISKIIYGQKKYIFGLRCLPKDVYFGLSPEDAGMYDSPVYSCKFGASEDTRSILGCAHEDGSVLLQQTNGPKEGGCLISKVVHKNAIFGLTWIPKKNELLTAAADSTVGLLSAEDLRVKVLFRGHTKSVKTVDANAWDTNIFASAGQDCNVIIWDIRCQPTHKADEILGAHNFFLRHVNSPGLSRSCEKATPFNNTIISVLFREQHSLISAGTSDGLIKMWDLRKTYCRRKREPQPLATLEYAGISSCRGYTSMHLSPYRETVYVSCLDGKIYAYHLVNPTTKPVAEFYGHKPNTYFTKFCVSPCGSYLLSGSSDNQAYIWQTSCPGTPIAALSGHEDEVTCVAWNSLNRETIVTCSDDMTHHLFRYKSAQLDSSDYRENQIGCGAAVPYQCTPDSLKPGARSNSTTYKQLEFSRAASLEPTQTRGSGTKGFMELPHARTSSSPLHLQLTPKQTRSKLGSEQVTPKTSETKTLLSWLSSSKIPKDRVRIKSDDRTTTHRISSKRKLADFMEGNQENLQNEESKPALSPSKHVLEDRLNLQITSQSDVAKALCYESPDSKDGVSSQFSDSESSDGFKKIDQIELSCHTQSTVQTPAKTLPPNNHSSQLLSSPNSGLLLASPTVNLPNYVVDGKSPHHRREHPMSRRPQTDWLTSLSQKHSVNVAQESKPPKKIVAKRTSLVVTRKRKSRRGSVHK